MQASAGCCTGPWPTGHPRRPRRHREASAAVHADPESPPDRRQTARFHERSGLRRAHISGFAFHASGVAPYVSLGRVLGAVTMVAMVFGVPMGVRRVARTTGPLERAVGFGVMHQRGGPWCFANMATTGLTDRSTRFHLAFHAALRSRGIRLADRRISGAA